MTAGLAERLTLGGSGRKVDITGGLVSTGDSLLTTPMRELKRISGLDFLRIYRTSVRSHTLRDGLVFIRFYIWTLDQHICLSLGQIKCLKTLHQRK